MKLNFNLIGAAILLVSAGILALTGIPGSSAPLKTAEDVSKIALAEEDKIDPALLGEWIIEKKNDFVVVDLRSPIDFADFNIPGSVNIPFVSLMTKEGMNALPKAKKIVLAASDEARAGQAWMVLRGRGTQVFLIKGGILGWWNKVMTPVSVQGEMLNSADAAEYAAKLKVMREVLGGGGGISSGAAPETPVTIPPPVSAPAGGGAKKKKAGGC